MLQKRQRKFKLTEKKSSSQSKPQPSKRAQTLSKEKDKVSKKSLSITKGIPRTLGLEDEGIIEENFSYVEEGFQNWKRGHFLKGGKVWEAINIKTGVIAAIKEIDGSETSKRKQRQLNIIKKLNHPNVVEYYAHYKIKNKIYMIMEYVPMNLRKFYLTYGPPPTETFLFFAKQILQVFAELHHQKIFHQDFKCQNVLVNNNGIIKLCDFGLSKKFETTLSMVRDMESLEQTFLQTCWWTPPEKLNGDRYDRGKADIWSIGCTFVQLLNGNFPWAEKSFGKNRIQVAKHIINSDETPGLPENSDSRVVKLVGCCLQRNPEERMGASAILNRWQIWKKL